MSQVKMMKDNRVESANQKSKIMKNNWKKTLSLMREENNATPIC